MKRLTWMLLLCLGGLLPACHDSDPAPAILTQEGWTDGDASVEVLASSQEATSWISLCTQAALYDYNPAVDRSSGLVRNPAFINGFTPAINAQYAAQIFSAGPDVNANPSYSLYLQARLSASDIRVDLDSLGIGHAAPFRGGVARPAACLSTLYGDPGQVGQGNTYSYLCMPVSSDAGMYAYLRRLPDVDGRIHALHEQLVQLPEAVQPQVTSSNDLYSAWACGSFFVMGHEQLYRLDTAGNLTAVSGLPQQPGVFLIAEGGKDTVLAICAADQRLHYSTDGGRSFGYTFGNSDFARMRYYRCGPVLVATLGHFVYTYRWGTDQTARRMRTDGMPKAPIQAVYKAGSKIIFLTEAGIYSRPFAAFVADFDNGD